jgi:hypothetical protein
MSTGLIAGQVYEKKTAELYAADAGVEDAFWKIQNEVDELPWPGRCGNYTTWTYPEEGQPEWIVNGKNVTVTIEFVNDVNGVTYRVISKATANGSGTQIEAYIAGTPRYDDYSGLLDQVITVNEDLEGNTLTQFENELGKVDIRYPTGCEECAEIYNYEDIPPGCEGCGAVYNYDDEFWPSSKDLSDWYLEDVENEMTYYGDTKIDLKGSDFPPGPIYIDVNNEPVGSPSELGPLYVRDGGLDIINSATNSPATLTLGGTLYITGNTFIDGKEKGPLNLNLNKQTIFVESDSTHSENALWITQKVTIQGPGVIIAVGDIYFAPTGDVGDEENPVFILSLEGTVTLQPSGTFYGAIAGNVYVDVSSGHLPTVYYPTEGFGELNFPGVTPEVRLIYSIASWKPDPL